MLSCVGVVIKLGCKIDFIARRPVRRLHCKGSDWTRMRQRPSILFSNAVKLGVGSGVNSGVPVG
jgi:hypothetical protein